MLETLGLGIIGLAAAALLVVAIFYLRWALFYAGFTACVLGLVLLVGFIFQANPEPPDWVVYTMIGGLLAMMPAMAADV